jgi:hypothetical protein
LSIGNDTVRKADKYALTGDADGISRGSSGKTSAIAFPAVQPHPLEVLKAVSNAFVAEEQALADVGPDRVLQAFKTACTRISVFTSIRSQTKPKNRQMRLMLYVEFVRTLSCVSNEEARICLQRLDHIVNTGLMPRPFSTYSRQCRAGSGTVRH